MQHNVHFIRVSTVCHNLNRGTEIHHDLENSTCDPLKYTMGTLILILSICMGKSIGIERVEIDHEIICMVILLPSADSRRIVVSYKLKYVHEVLVYCLVKLAQEKVWLGELTIPI